MSRPLFDVMPYPIYPWHGWEVISQIFLGRAILTDGRETKYHAWISTTCTVIPETCVGWRGAACAAYMRPASGENPLARGGARKIRHCAKRAHHATYICIMYIYNSMVMYHLRQTLIDHLLHNTSWNPWIDLDWSSNIGYKCVCV